MSEAPIYLDLATFSASCSRSYLYIISIIENMVPILT